MNCRVCGSPDTVKSHLLPRAFIKKMRGKYPAALSGTLDKVGIDLTQSGQWDGNILCETHESHLKDCDDYASDLFCRFERQGSEPVELGGRIRAVPNPKPHLMKKFICSVIWRHAVSDQFNSGMKLNLGAYEPQLRGMIFHDLDFDPDINVACRDFLVSGIPVRDIYIAPHHNAHYGRRAFQFHIFGIRFLVKLDGRMKGRMSTTQRGNFQNPLWVWKLSPVKAADFPSFVQIIANMDDGWKPAWLS